MVLRRIETRIPTIEELSLPAVIKTLAMTKRGLIMKNATYATMPYRNAIARPMGASFVESGATMTRAEPRRFALCLSCP